MNRPEKNEYDPYYETYISLVGNGDIVDTLERQAAEMEEIFSAIPEEKGPYAYAAGKWTIKELLGHMIDGERIFMYRVFRISRADKTPIEGFEQDGYIENAHANSRAFADLLAEFAALRRANVIAYRNFTDHDWLRTGTANELEITPRAMAYIMAGHIMHHLNILRTHYLAG
jgi:uncharacterized damage-inducible protein DinB